MSLIPEYIFRSAIQRGIRALRDDTRLIDQLFRNVDQESAGEMRDFLLKNRIYIDVNYPREELQIPAIIILLKSETESQAFLGDIMGVDCEPDAFSFDTFEQDELADEILGGAASVSDLNGLGSVSYGPARALTGTANTLKATFAAGDAAWASSQYAGRGHTVHLIGGTGVGQQRGINANGSDTLMVSPNWQVTPDATTVFVIRNQAQEVIGQPRAIFNKSGGARTERLGSLYNLQHQIQIIGPNPEFTIYLHAIVKSIFTLSRTFLEGQGIINMKMGATDFIPRTEYQPDFAYMRALNVDFQYPFDIFSELGELAEEFRLRICQATEDGPVIMSDVTSTVTPTSP